MITLGDYLIRCPKGCDVATPPDHQPDGSWVCTACGHQFRVELKRLHDDNQPEAKIKRR